MIVNVVDIARVVGSVRPVSIVRLVGITQIC